MSTADSPLQPREVTLAEWAHELRTTDSAQGRGRLYVRDGDGFPKFCCLGILAERMGVLAPPDEFGNRQVHLTETDYYSGSLPQEILPAWLSHEQQRAAIYANDTCGWPFPKIADWAESGMKLDEYNNPVSPESAE